MQKKIVFSFHCRVRVPSAIAKGTSKREKNQIILSFSERKYIRHKPKVRVSERKAMLAWALQSRDRGRPKVKSEKWKSEKWKNSLFAKKSPIYKYECAILIPLHIENLILCFFTFHFFTFSLSHIFMQKEYLFIINKYPFYFSPNL